MVELICDEKLRQELVDFYHDVDDRVIAKLKDLCVIHNISESAVCAELLAFLLKNPKKGLTLEVIEDFQTDYLDKKAIQDYKKSKTPNRPKNNALTANKSINLLMNEINAVKESPKLNTTMIEIASNDSDIEELPTKVTNEKESEDNSEIECMDITAIASQSSPIPELDDTINTSLKCPPNSNVLCSFGSSHSEEEWINRSKVAHSVDVFDENTTTDKYKFMYLKIAEANEIMNGRIDEFAEQIAKTLDIEHWSQFSYQSPNESYYIGRVCHDCTNAKLTEHSVRFETSSLISNNESVRLDLSHLKSFSLFPGQLLACKGINESGSSLFVEEIIDLDRILTYPKTVPKLTKPVHIVVAVGPFTCNDLDFECFKKFIEYCKQYEPDFCIIIGPFIDSSNEKLLSTEDKNVDQIFNSMMRYISEELNNLKTEAIVIPSIKDLNTFSVLPTMPFNCTSNVLMSPKIHYFSNPTVITISGIVIGITSTDVLLHMSKELLSVGQISDRLSLLCKHILTQKNFYPIFPPNPEVNLEFTRYHNLHIPVTPHILILASDIKEFIKSTCNSIVINSGRISKSRICRIRVNPFDENDYNGSLEGHADVEIIKLDI